MHTALAPFLERRWRALHTAARVIFVQRDVARASLEVAIYYCRPRDLSEEAIESALYNQLQQQHGPWSMALRAQLLASVKPVVQLADLRPTLLHDEWKKLTLAEQTLLRGVYDERRSVLEKAATAQQTPTQWFREFTLVHVELFQRLQMALPDESHVWPSNHVELTRLILCLSFGYEAEDAQLVLESLLLGDPPSQAFYQRMIALISELDAHFHGLPPLPKPQAMQTLVKRARREVYVAIAFVFASIGALAYIIWLVTR